MSKQNRAFSRPSAAKSDEAPIKGQRKWQSQIAAEREEELSQEKANKFTRKVRLKIKEREGEVKKLKMKHMLKSTALALATIVCFGAALPPVSAAPTAPKVIYTEGFETGNTLHQNGNVEFARSNNFASQGEWSLRVAPTADNNYSGMALKSEDMIPGGVYHLTGKAYSETNATVGVRVETTDSAGGNTYGSVGFQKPTLQAGTWADIDLEFTVPIDHQKVNAIVFHNDDKIPGLVFYLDDIKLVTVSEPQKELTELMAFRFNEEDKEAQASLLLPAGDAAEIQWINQEGAGREDNTALQIKHIADKTYNSKANAVRLTFAEPIPVGGIYNISFWAYVSSAENAGKGTLSGAAIVLNGDYSSSTYKFPESPKPLTLDGWQEINVTTPLMNVPIKTIDFRLGSNDQPTHADVWYMDDIVISRVGDLQDIEIPEWDLSLASLAEAYKEYFIVGNIMEPHQTTDQDTVDMFKHHYKMVTAENAMKPEYLSPAKGQYTFTDADKIVDWALANGIKVHGHTLLWHSQSANWLTKNANGSALTRAEARENMQEYITNVTTHYKGKLFSWEVLNEALDGGSSIPTDWRTVMRKSSPWYQAYANGADASKGESGADYVYDAFVFARLADPGTTLYYNDFNENEPWKREAMAMMAEDLNAKWAEDERNTEPGRLLIEGLAMQSHYWAGAFDVSSVEATIKRFIKAGVKVSISELDIPAGTYSNQAKPPLTKEQEKQQAKCYAELFEVYKKYADSIERVTIWGKADNQSWRSFGSPLMFSSSFRAKEAYFAAMNPEEYLGRSKADKTELIGLIAEAAEKVETVYTPNSWAKLAEALQEAKAVAKNEKATQQEVDEQVAKLREAITSLVVYVPVEKIVLNVKGVTNISVKQTQQISVSVNPEEATNPSITWTSSNTKVAVVDENGVVTGVSRGMVVIRAISSDNDKVSASTIVKINP